MGQLLEAIENSTTKAVEAGGMLWKVQKINSAELAKVGHVALAFGQGLAVKDDKPKRKSKAKAKADEVEDVASMMANQPVEALETMAKLKDAVVAAGLIAVGDPESGEWEPVEAVLARDDADARAGRLWVGSIPNDVSDLLFQAVMDVSTDGGAALERLRAFRGQPGDPASDRSGRQAVRKAAK
tara:strand:+ start:80 stop:631 length:552 start_codon:yes stop_codon:yes gene_type:complete